MLLQLLRPRSSTPWSTKGAEVKKGLTSRVEQTAPAVVEKNDELRDKIDAARERIAAQVAKNAEAVHDTAVDAVPVAMDAAKNAKTAVKEAAENATDAAKDIAQSAADAAKSTAKTAASAAKDVAETAKKTAKSAADAAKKATKK